MWAGLALCAGRQICERSGFIAKADQPIEMMLGCTEALR